MKKAICILLILAVMMTCCVVGVSAKCTIPDTLREQMDAVENGKFKVHIWLYCPIDKSTVFQQAIKECGFGSVNHAKAVFKKRFGMTMRDWRSRS